MSKIPVFVSCPTLLNDKQKEYNKLIDSLLADFEFERRAIGKSDFAVETPLEEVLQLARHCAGGLILGFEQTYIESGEQKRGTEGAKVIKAPYLLATPWNDIEAGILFTLGLPLLIYKEKNVYGGVFDVGSSRYFINELPTDLSLETEKLKMRHLFTRWAAKVRERYDSLRY